MANESTTSCPRCGKTHKLRCARCSEPYKEGRDCYRAGYLSKVCIANPEDCLKHLEVTAMDFELERALSMARAYALYSDERGQLSYFTEALIARVRELEAFRAEIENFHADWINYGNLPSKLLERLEAILGIES